MSIDALSETSETVPPSTMAKAAVHKLLDLPGNFIESPNRAKSFLRLDKFWSETVPNNLHIPKDREIFLGFDYDENLGQLVCTETALGEKDCHEPKKHHLVMLHTEPANSPESMSLNLGPIHLFRPSKTTVFADNLPATYFGDMHFMLKDPSIYAEIIIRLGLNDDPVAILVALRTNQSKDVSSKLLKFEFKDFALNEKHPLSQRLNEDEIVTQKGGFAIYRGFTSLPPKRDDILRLRRFS